MNREQMDLHLHECTRLCWECRDLCQDTLFNHVIERGSGNLDTHAVRLLADCMDICQAAADFMRRNSRMHGIICNACALICEACADACETLGKEYATARRCVEACNACADSCRLMSRMEHAA